MKLVHLCYKIQWSWLKNEGELYVINIQKYVLIKKARYINYNYIHVKMFLMLVNTYKTYRQICTCIRTQKKPLRRVASKQWEWEIQTLTLHFVTLLSSVLMKIFFTLLTFKSFNFLIIYKTKIFGNIKKHKLFFKTYS